MVTRETKCKHLTDDERQSIQDGLKNGCSFKHIVRRTGNGPKTVSEEVKKLLEVRPAKDQNEQALHPWEKLVKAPFVCKAILLQQQASRGKESYVIVRYPSERCSFCPSYSGQYYNCEIDEVYFYFRKKGWSGTTLFFPKEKCYRCYKRPVAFL